MTGEDAAPQDAQGIERRRSPFSTDRIETKTSVDIEYGVNDDA